MTEKIAEQIKETFIRIEYLEKLINSMQQNLILTWTILGVVVTILSITITILVKKWIDKKVEEQLKTIKNDLIDLWKNNPQFYYDSGKANIILYDATEKYTKNNKNNVHYEYHINVRESFTLDFPTNIRLYHKTEEGKKVVISNFQIIEHNKNYLRIGYESESLGKDAWIASYQTLYYEIIWENLIYKRQLDLK